MDDVLIYVESHTKYEDLNNLPPTPAKRKNHVTSEALHGETEDHCFGGARKKNYGLKATPALPGQVKSKQFQSYLTACQHKAKGT